MIPQKVSAYLVCPELMNFSATLDIELNKLFPCDLWMWGKIHNRDINSTNYGVYSTQGRNPLALINSMRGKAAMTQIEEKDNVQLLPETGKAAWAWDEYPDKLYRGMVWLTVEKRTVKEIQVPPEILTKAVRAAIKKHPLICNDAKFPLTFWIRAKK